MGDSLNGKIAMDAFIRYSRMGMYGLSAFHLAAVADIEYDPFPDRNFGYIARTRSYNLVGSRYIGSPTVMITSYFLNGSNKGMYSSNSEYEAINLVDRDFHPNKGESPTHIPMYGNFNSCLQSLFNIEIDADTGIAHSRTTTPFKFSDHIDVIASAFGKWNAYKFIADLNDYGFIDDRMCKIEALNSEIRDKTIENSIAERRREIELLNREIRNMEAELAKIWEVGVQATDELEKRKEFGLTCVCENNKEFKMKHGDDVLKDPEIQCHNGDDAFPLSAVKDFPPFKGTGLDNDGDYEDDPIML